MKGYERIKLKEPMTTEELFEKIKDGNYPQGAPTLSGSGKGAQIDFPPNNKYKPMAIASGKSITISQVYNGVGGLVQEMGMETLTNGWSTIFNKDRNKNSDDIVMIKNEIVRILGL